LIDVAVGLAFDANDLIELHRIEIDYRRSDARPCSDAQSFLMSKSYVDPTTNRSVGQTAESENITRRSEKMCRSWVNHDDGWALDARK
jgi:hypothetical protein